VAAEPLKIVSPVDGLWYWGRESYSAPSARISATEILVLGFMSRSQTREIGRSARVQSAHTLRALCAYVDPDTVLSLTHDPV
jgi:hypothetical protein